MKRDTCSACGSPDLEQFLDLGESPIADAYTDGPSDETPTYPLQVAVCGKCRLVQLLEVLPADVLFGTGYSFYSSASAPLSAYHADYAKDVLSEHGAIARRRGVLEVGSNDGDLLRHFRHMPHLGVDPSTGPASVAAERGCKVLANPFSLHEAQIIRGEHGPYGVVIANHVLAHVEDVSDCLAGIAHVMDSGSVAIIEVQYVLDLLVNNAFDLVYHEHRNFFSLSSLEVASGRHGLHVIDAELTDRQGGSIRVTLSKSPASRSPRVETIKRSEQWLNSFGAYESMQGRANRIRWRLKSLVLDQEGTVAAYGAAAKVTTLLSFCGLTVEHLPFCVDTTPAKQGRHIPGTGIPIVSPEDAPHADAFLLGSWNYLGAITRANPGKRWIVPFPAPFVIG